jgi:hypothetical protein
MKRPKPGLYNNRVIYLATRVVSFPFVVAAAVYRGTAARGRRVERVFAIPVPRGGNVLR